MRTLSVLLFASIVALMAMPVSATECANSGTPPGIAPDDDGDGTATACGSSAVAGGVASTALGAGVSSAGNFSTALGSFASSAGFSSTALGYEASSAGHLSIALGNSASSAGDSSIALGDNASAANLQSTAVGYLASSTGDFSTAVGQLASAAGIRSTALGDSSSSAGIRSTAVGYSANAGGDFSTALGYVAFASATETTAVGHGAASTGTYSTALGYAANADASSSTALGALAYASQPNSLVLGSIAGVHGATAYANVGIGTSAPSEAVDVQRSAAAARFQLSSFTDTANEAPQFIQRRARGTSAAPVAVQNGDNLGLFSFRGYNGTSMGGSRATITAQAAGTFTGASNPTRLIFSTTPVGSTTPQSVLVITPDGKVQVNGQNLTVPDYVFGDDYALMPLDELQAFIDEHGHLPGIASADEVNAGVHDLAGSDMAHLQKIEELTLYTLQLQDQVRQQQARIVELETLQDRVAQLEMSAQTRALADHD